MGYGIAQTNTSGGSGSIAVITVTMTGPTTITPPSISAPASWILILNQDSTGGRVATFPTADFAGAAAFVGMLLTGANTYSSFLFTIRASDGKSLLVGAPATGISTT